MAVTPLSITFDTSLEDALALATAASIGKHGREEVLDCLDMAGAWREWFQERFGTLSGVAHRSPPDDPPDVELIFQEICVAVEHTRLQPAPLGWADDIASKIEPSRCINIPSVSDPPKNRKELSNRILCARVRPVGAGTNRERAVILESLLSAAKQKMRRLSQGGVICVVDRVCLSNFEFQVISGAALEIVDSDEFIGCDSYTLVILSRDGPNCTRSALLRRKETIAFRGFIPEVS